MSSYSNRFYGSADGETWIDITDVCPHPSWTVSEALEWADGHIKRSHMKTYPFVELRRREGIYRPRGDWRVIGIWKDGERDGRCADV